MDQSEEVICCDNATQNSFQSFLRFFHKNNSIHLEQKYWHYVLPQIFCNPSNENFFRPMTSICYIKPIRYPNLDFSFLTLTSTDGAKLHKILDCFVKLVASFEIIYENEAAYKDDKIHHTDMFKQFARYKYQKIVINRSPAQRSLW